VSYADEAAEGLAKLLANRFDVRVVVVGDAADVPVALRGYNFFIEADAAAETLGTWTAQLWTPHIVDGAIADDALLYDEASYAGVPTVLPVEARHVIDGFPSPPLVVQSPDQPEQWAAALRHVVDSKATRAARAQEVSRRAEAVDAAMTARLTVNRLLGWARYEDRR
jgi:hypothetical protein